MHKIFPHIKNTIVFAQSPIADRTVEAVPPEMAMPSETSIRTLPRESPPVVPPSVDQVSESRWFRFGRSARAMRRTLLTQYKTVSLKVELYYRRQMRRLGATIIGLSATLLSLLIAAIFYSTADQSAASWKASETHLAAAQVIGAALALVLALSIIPAQRAAELFSIAILKLFGKDRALLTVFLVLVAATLTSLLLGSSWLRWLEPKLSLSAQFILLGISFDALRRFYLRTLDMLAPETVINRVLKECDNEIGVVRRAAEKLVDIQVASTGKASAADQLLHASVIVRSNLPKTMSYWSSQLEEFAHRFIARRDSNATIGVLDALEAIAFRYAELRKKSVTLHIDWEFPFAGALTDVSDVLDPIYESVLHIIDDAVAAKNERVVQSSIRAMGRMTSHAMSVVAMSAGGQKIAPLAFGACYYFDRAIRSALAANMVDPALTAVTSIQSILVQRVPEVDVSSMISQANETLFAIAIDGYTKSNSILVFKSVRAMLAAIHFEIEKEFFSDDSLRSVLGRILLMIPAEIVADKAGTRRLQTFPAYDLGFQASIPFLLQTVATKVRVDSERPWIDPFRDFSDVVEIIRDHYRSLSKIDFQGTLFGKWVVDSLNAVLRVQFGQLTHPADGTEGFVSAVEDDLKAMISWVSGFFPAGASNRRHYISDATSQLAVLGIDALAEGFIEVAMSCATAIQRIATNTAQGQIDAYSLADIHQGLEILARAAELVGKDHTAVELRAMIAMPQNIDLPMQNHILEAGQTRGRQLDQALAAGSHRPYRADTDPVERLRNLTLDIRARKP
jgi:hypothetical protein